MGKVEVSLFTVVFCHPVTPAHYGEKGSVYVQQLNHFYNTNRKIFHVKAFMMDLEE